MRQIELKSISTEKLLDELARRSGGDLKHASSDDLAYELILRHRAEAVFVEPFETVRLSIKGPATVLTIFES